MVTAQASRWAKSVSSCVVRMMAGSSPSTLDDVLNLEELQRVAHGVLERGDRDYFEGGTSVEMYTSSDTCAQRQ